MMCNLKDFEEQKTTVEPETIYGAAYDYRGYRVAWGRCQSNRGTYYTVWVDGEVVATRTKRRECERKAIAYLNANQ